MSDVDILCLWVYHLAGITLTFQRCFLYYATVSSPFKIYYNYATCMYKIYMSMRGRGLGGREKVGRGKLSDGRKENSEGWSHGLTKW